MHTKKFSLLQAFRFGFYTLIEHFAFFLGLMLTYLGVMIGCVGLLLPLFLLPFSSSLIAIMKLLDQAGATKVEVIKNSAKHMGPTFIVSMALFSCLLFLVHHALMLGLTKISFDFCDFDASKIKELFCCYGLAIRESIAALLYWLMVVIGFGLLIVPGVYCMLTFRFYRQAIVDKNMGIFDAFSYSAALTKGSRWELLGLVLLVGLLHWISYSFVIASFFIMMPVGSLIDCYVYRQLQKAPAI